MGKYFYHITAPENIESILLYGLRANEEGDIFLFENKSIGSVGVGQELSNRINRGRKPIAIK